MGWLLELLVEGIREMLSQFVIDMMTLVTDMFTELLSCDLSLFEELFSVVGDLYKNVVLPMGIALLLLICVWQLFKSMFGKAGVASEDPIELVCRTGISLFFIVAAKPLVDYILAVAGTPYQWITGTDVEVSSFSEYVSVLEGLTGGLGIDSLNIAILMLIMQFVVAWNYFKMLFVIAERYVLLGVFSYTAPGKTFTMQLMALRLRRKNVQVFIIAPDKGHEFARACNNIGGAFIQISPASPNCINVMEIRPTDRTASEILDGYTVERSELAMKIQSLHIFFSLLIPDLSHEEKQLLDEALVITYAEKGITHDNQSLEDSDNPGQYKDMPILGDLHEVLLRKRECRRMANILNRLVHGSAATFNQKTNVDLSNKYVVLDISELSGDLLLGMFVALDFVWAKAKEDRTVEKAIFVDEAWKLLVSNELAGEYLLEIFKVIRAYGGSAICATQDLVDFFALKGGKLGRGILNNSKTKIILNMEPSEAENIRKELDLSEAEAMSIARFERGTGLISTNSNNLIVDFKASQLEKDLITTDRKDLQELKERLQKYGRQAYGKQAI